jgi:protease I
VKENKEEAKAETKKKSGVKPKKKAEEKPKEKAKKTTEEKKEKPVKEAAKAPEKPAKKAKEKAEKAAKKSKEYEEKHEEGAKKVKEKKEKKGREIEKITFYEKRKLEGDEKRLFKVSYKQKKKRPKFARQELTFRTRIDDAWRKPRGIDSKQAEEKRGKGCLPKVGYKSPNLVSGLHPTGYKPVIVHNVNDISKLDNKIEAAIISAVVGRKKRNDIIKMANEKKIVILNPRKGEIREKLENKALFGKKILMVIAPKDFRDEELKTPKEIFEANGAAVTVAGITKDNAKGLLGAEITPDVEISHVDAGDYNAVIFVGGPGAQEHLWDNKEAQKLARESNKKGNITGAICLAPVVLARAGVLEGKEAAVFKSDDTKAEFESSKVKYTKKMVAVSGKIVTANGPEAAKAFALKIVEMMKIKH